MTSKRVLFVVNQAAFFLSHRLPLAVEALKRGYEVHVATPGGPQVDRIRDAGLAWHPIRLWRSSIAPHRELTTVSELVRLYRRLRPDLVHHVTIKPVLYGTVAARVTRVPAVVNAITGMGHAFSHAPGHALLGRAIATVYRSALRHPNMKVIFQNVEQKDAFIREGAIRADEAVLIRGSGVDTNVYYPGASDSNGQPVVAMISRMLETKGVREFVGAAKQLCLEGVPARFVLIGEPDPDNPGSVPLAQLEAWGKEGSVEYWGWRDNIPSVLRKIDVVALPSYYAEGVPKSLIEAAATGLPIVTTDTPGCRDIVRDGENGLLIPFQNVEALADAMRRFIADPCFRQKAGCRGRERVIEAFSLSHVVSSTMDVYADLLG